jgi:hypothetical protein
MEAIWKFGWIALAVLFLFSLGCGGLATTELDSGEAELSVLAQACGGETGVKCAENE